MSIVEEMEFERLEPICSRCGALLTFDEWELNDDVCSDCFEEEFEEDED